MIESTNFALKAAIRKAPVIVQMLALSDFVDFAYDPYVYKGLLCGQREITKSDLNHAMLAIGFGTHGTEEYILVKNSWGMAWGWYGYAYIYADRTSTTGTCGLYLENYSVISSTNSVA